MQIDSKRLSYEVCHQNILLGLGYETSSKKVRC